MFSDGFIHSKSFYPDVNKEQQQLSKQIQTDEIEYQDTITQTGNPKNVEIQVNQPFQMYQKNDKCDPQIIDNLIDKTQRYINETSQQRKLLNNYIKQEQNNIIKQQIKSQQIQLLELIDKCLTIQQLYIFNNYILIIYKDINGQMHSIISTISNIKDYHEIDILQQFVVRKIYMTQLNRTFLLINIQPDSFLLVSTNTFQIYQKIQIPQIQNQIVLLEKIQRQNTLIAVTDSNEIFVFSLQLNQQKKFEVKLESQHQLSRKKYGDIVHAQLLQSNNLQFSVLVASSQDIQQIQLQVTSQVGQKLIFQQKLPASTLTKALLIDNQLYKNLSTHRTLLLSQIIVVLTGNKNINIINKNSRLFNFGTQDLVDDFILYGVLVITLQGSQQIIVYNLLGEKIQETKLNDKFEKINIISQNPNYIKLGLINQDQNNIYQIIIDNSISNQDLVLQKLYKYQLE